MRKKSGFTKIVTAVLTAALLMTGVFTGTPAKVFAQTTGVVSADLLNLRSGASTRTPVLALLRKGAAVEIAETQGEWYKVTASINGTAYSGYVYSSYVTVGEEQKQTSEVSGTGIVNVSALNVRDSASLSGVILGVVSQGTKVTLKAAEGDWYKVDLVLNGSNVTAYVYKKYVTLADSNTDTDHVSELSGKGLVDVYGLNIRTGASTSSGILGVLSKNTEVEITGQSGDWYRINTVLRGSTVSGFVFAQYIKRNDNSAADTGNGEQADAGNGSQPDSEADNNNQAADSVSSTKGMVKAPLNLRSDASTNSKVITVLSVGTIVNIEAENNGWYKVITTANGKEVSGYVYAQYVRKISDQEAETGVVEVNATAEDEYLLACIVYCEATNQCYEGQLAVANVVLNRVKSPKWPDTIYDVIYQRNQFTPAHNGRLAKVLSSGPSEAAKKAAHDALAGINNVEGYYFFNGVVDTSTVTGYLVIQDHIFYYY